MKQKNKVLVHEFVEFIPETLEEGKIYVSIEYATMVHRCCCGCGKEVVTPLSPTGWELIFNGKTISLDPSIGNWSFPCRSHYWIRNNKVKWAEQWTQDEIDANRAHDRWAKKRYFGVAEGEKLPTPEKTETKVAPSKEGLWQKFRDWWLN